MTLPMQGIDERAQLLEPVGVAVEAELQEVAPVVVGNAQLLERAAEQVQQLEERPR